MDFRSAKTLFGRKRNPMTKNPACVLLALGLFLASVAALTAVAQSSGTPIAHNIWTSGAPLPIPVWCPIVATLNGQVYVIGGTNANGTEIADTQIYDPVTNTWSVGTPLPVPNCAVWPHPSTVSCMLLAAILTPAACGPTIRARKRGPRELQCLKPEPTWGWQC